MLLTKDEILAASDRPYEDVEVPEWGGTVRVRVWGGWERDRWDALKNGGSMPDDARAAIAAFSLVDDSGNRVFSDSDVKRLSEKSGAALDKVLAAVFRLNGIGQEELDAAKKN